MGNNPISRVDPLGDRDSSKKVIAPILIPQKKMPAVYQNHLNYLKKHPEEAIKLGKLTLIIFDYEPDEKKQHQNRTANKAANPVNNTDPTMQEDEVAPASTKQGGARGVRMAVPKGQNSMHGGQLGGMASSLKMKDGDQFLTILIPDTGSPEQKPLKRPSTWEMVKGLAIGGIALYAEWQSNNVKNIIDGIGRSLAPPPCGCE